MSNLYETISLLCEQRGIKPGRLCADLGISRGLMTDLKMGRKKGLNAETAQKIAAYFDVTVGYLLGEEEQKNPPVLTAKDERDIAKDLEAMMARLGDEDNLMFDGNPMSQEARESILAAMKLGLEAAKVKNKERFTPKKYKKG